MPVRTLWTAFALFVCSFLFAAPAAARSCLPASQICPSNCATCATQTTTCQYDQPCGTTTCPSGQTVVTLKACGPLGIERLATCQQTGQVGTSTCASCPANTFGLSCTACPNCNGGTCNSGINGNGSCSNCPAGRNGPFCQ